MAEQVKEFYNVVRDEVTPTDIIDFDLDINPYTYPLESLFETREISGRTFDFTQNTPGRVMAARYHALNSATDLMGRETYKISSATLLNAQIEIQLDEDDIMILNNPRNDVEFQNAMERIYRDSARTRWAIKEKQELQRAEVITTGLLSIDENGYKSKTDGIDFGIPKANKVTFDWSDKETRKILDDIMDLTDKIANNEDAIRPTRMLVNSSVINKLLEDENIRKILSTYNPLSYPTRGDLNNWLKAHDLPELIPISRKISKPDDTNSKVKQEVDVIPKDKIIFIPEGNLGTFVTGTRPEEFNADSTMTTSKAEGIITSTFSQHDPEGYFVKSSSRFITTIARPRQIGIATVTWPS